MRMARNMLRARREPGEIMGEFLHRASGILKARLSNSSANLILDTLAEKLVEQVTAAT